MKLAHRQNVGKTLHVVFALVTIFAVFVLGILLSSILDRSFGLTAFQYEVPFEYISPDGSTLEETSDEALLEIMRYEIRPLILETIELKTPLDTMSRKDLEELLAREVMLPEVVHAYGLWESLTDRQGILARVAEEFPDAYVVFRSWVNADFLTGSQSSDPLQAGILGAIMGTFLIIIVTMVVSFPIGVAAAIYLEEYAPDTRLTRFIQTNIYNLAGVPSIIYGMLGLALFVRGLEGLTQGRTVISAGLTLAILILPIIIINTQEALKAVPQSLRQASFALGGKRWQTIWHHVLPACMDRILTGTVLAMSRAIGETAPLVVVGASTFLTHNPSSLFDRFTTMPIQIYQWTSLPNEAYRNLSAAAILVLLVLLISFNSFAIIMRNKYRKENNS